MAHVSKVQLKNVPEKKVSKKGNGKKGTQNGMDR